MKSFTVEEFEESFDELFSRVENGETFIITSESGNVVILPHKEIESITDDELVRIHTNHEEGS